MSNNNLTSVVVAQHGSRHGYAIPRMLDSAGMLAALFTDSNASSSLGRVAQLLPEALAPKSFRRLKARRPLGISGSKLYSSDYPVLRRFLAGGGPESDYELWCSTLSTRMQQWFPKVQPVTHVYNMYAENLEFLRFIKSSSSAKVLLDVYVHPKSTSIVHEEAKRFGVPPFDEPGIGRVSESKIYEALSLADTLVCPSEFVASGVRDFSSSFEQKIVICPYGSILPAGDARGDLATRYILWAGGDWFRKGLHIYSAAQQLLGKADFNHEFRVAGLDRFTSNSFDFSKLRFLGKLSRDEMRAQLQSATVFVLPTFAEGLASTLLEAMSLGCPVVTTRASGLPEAIDGVCGRIVPTADPSAVSEAVLEICRDEHLRRTFSENAKRMSSEYTEEAWQRRFLALFAS